MYGDYTVSKQTNKSTENTMYLKAGGLTAHLYINSGYNICQYGGKADTKNLKFFDDNIVWVQLPLLTPLCAFHKIPPSECFKE